MNLIEQLGGYEKARDSLRWLANNDTEYKQEESPLYHACLEYRRQHNIFDIGDIVKNKKSTLLARVNKVTKAKVYVDMLNHTSMDFIHRHEFFIADIEHAIPEEIQAGKRLP